MIIININLKKGKEKRKEELNVVPKRWLVPISGLIGCFNHSVWTKIKFPKKKEEKRKKKWSEKVDMKARRNVFLWSRGQVNFSISSFPMYSIHTLFKLRLSTVPSNSYLFSLREFYHNLNSFFRVFWSLFRYLFHVYVWVLELPRWNWIR